MMIKNKFAWISASLITSSLLVSQMAQAKTPIEFWYSGGTKPQKMMTKLIQEFNQNQDQYTIVPSLQGNYTETYQKLQAGLASGTAPALTLLSGGQAKVMAERHLVEDLRPLIKPSFHFDDFVSAFRKQVTAKNGMIIGLPAYGTTQILYYNKKILAKYGFSAKDLATWQGLAKVAKAVTRKGSDGQPIFYGWEPMWGADNLIDAAYSNGGDIISKDGKKILFDSPKWITVWDGFRKWIHQDHVMRIHYGGQGWEYWYKTIDDVMKDRALGYTGSSGDQGDLDFSKIAATVQPGWGNHPAAPEAGAQVLQIPMGTKPAQAKGAFAFMKFYTNAKNTAAWSMYTGYIPVRGSAKQDPDYQAFTKDHPQALVPLEQTKLARPTFVDPTKGKILDALKVAADQVEIQNVPAAQALKQAARVAQRALDRANRHH
ncbi:extracellular solute-binding protein [Celerinatantimonas yamalensis]|uniref:Extracellular solute-binding protein n=1 Tax=Celerinatantimonas yamalensis TaxID=559956 RepID=A0ABW9G367_9GAMM